MYTFGVIVFVLLSCFLILLILLRPSEGGGGLGGAFGGGGSADSPFGVRAVQTLDKVIAGTALLLMLIAIAMAISNNAG